MIPSIVLTLVICLSAVTLTHAFDWSDPDFNLILQEDILDNLDVYDLLDDDDLSFNRHRVVRAVDGNSKRQPANPDCIPKEGGRGGPGHHKFQRSCCGERDDLKMHGEALRKLRKECLVDVRKMRMNKLNAEDDGPLDLFNCERVKRNREDMICVMECVAKKKEMADADGNLLQEKVATFVRTELVTEDWQKSLIDSVITKCLQQNTSVTNGTSDNSLNAREVARQQETSMNCNPSSLKFSHCLWREMQLSCPEDKIKNTKQCEKMRERLLKQESPNFPKKGSLGAKQKRPDSKSDD